MPRPRGDDKANRGQPTPRKDAGGETVSGYFRRVFAENPKLLNSRSNDELLSRWLADHPGEKEVPERIRQNLSNVKSILRKKQRKRGRRRQEQDQAAGAPARPAAARRASDSLEALEEHIDEALTLARVIDREGLQSVIHLLRRARNEVVWKQGQ
jgi:hypothetical protein